jgi:thiol-disulfide isomerase/thioredoxin
MLGLISDIALWVLMGILYVAVLMLYRHFGQQLVSEQERQDAQGPKVDESAEVVVETIDGRDYSLSEARRSHLIAFTSPKCPTCAQIQPVLASLAAKENNGTAIMIVHRGDAGSARSYVEKLPDNVIAVADQAGDLFRHWKVRSTPFCVVTDPNAVVKMKGVGTSGKRLRSLFDAANRAALSDAGERDSFQAAGSA